MCVCMYVCLYVCMYVLGYGYKVDCLDSCRTWMPPPPIILGHYLSGDLTFGAPPPPIPKHLPTPLGMYVCTHQSTGSIQWSS